MLSLTLATNLSRMVARRLASLEEVAIHLINKLANTALGLEI
jgi:hypothetical protein